jgi:hypothetical protein
MFRSKLVGLIILVIFGGVITQCSSASRDDSGQITKSGDLDVTETRVGDCFIDFPNVTESSVDVASIKASPCSEPHSWQVFHKSIISLDEYAEEAVINASNDICTNATEALFASLSLSKLNEHKNSDINILNPTQQGWQQGNKTVDCLIGSDTQIYYTSVLD